MVLYVNAISLIETNARVRGNISLPIKLGSYWGAGAAHQVYKVITVVTLTATK